MIDNQRHIEKAGGTDSAGFAQALTGVDSPRLNVTAEMFVKTAIAAGRRRILALRGIHTINIGDRVMERPIIDIYTFREPKEGQDLEHGLSIAASNLRKEIVALEPTSAKHTAVVIHTSDSLFRGDNAKAISELDASLDRSIVWACLKTNE